MVERRGGSGLLGEALFPFEVDHRLAGQDLDGDRTPQTRVERPVNRAHASLAQLFDYAIVPERLPDHALLAAPFGFLS